MKSEAGCSTSPVDHQRQREVIDKPGSSPKSAIGRLYRKLSPRRKAEKRCGGVVEYDAPEARSRIDERVFRYLDEDGDGRISAAELQSCVRSMGGELSEEEAATAVASLDCDGDGLLGLEDFGKLMMDQNEKEDLSLREAFRMYEMEEGCGCITPKSLKRMLSRLGLGESYCSNQDCKAMIRPFDLNGDGVLSFDEFRIMMS